jgi:nucleoside-diphosphate-sugar epimerase
MFESIVHNTRMRNVLVTGASGFIGRKLVGALQSSNNLYEITCLTRENTKFYPNVNTLIGDLNDWSFIDSLVDYEFDEVFHLAWEGIPDLGEYFSSLNLKNSINLISTLRFKNKKIRFNIFGSCLEYGNRIGKVDDTDLPNGENPFSKSKIELFKFISNLEVAYQWYRPFYVFGEGQRQGSLIPTIINKVQSGNRVNLNDYNNSHDFISVDDLAEAVITIAQSQYSGPVNIGTGISTCVGEIVNEFYKYYGIKHEQDYVAKPSLTSDSTLLDKELNWKPKYAGARGIIEYYLGEELNDR